MYDIFFTWSGPERLNKKTAMIKILQDCASKGFTSTITEHTARIPSVANWLGVFGVLDCAQAWQWAGPGSLSDEKNNNTAGSVDLVSAEALKHSDKGASAHRFVAINCFTLRTSSGCGCAAPTQQTRSRGCAEVSSPHCWYLRVVIHGEKTGCIAGFSLTRAWALCAHFSDDACLNYFMFKLLVLRVQLCFCTMKLRGPRRMQLSRTFPPPVNDLRSQARWVWGCLLTEPVMAAPLCYFSHTASACRRFPCAVFRSLAVLGLYLDCSWV